MTIVRDINAAMDFSAIDSSCGLALVDQAGEIISANPAFLNLFALPPDVRNKTFSDLTDAMNPAAAQLLRKTLTSQHEKASKLTVAIDHKTISVYVIELNQVQRLIMVESSPSSPLSPPETNPPALTPHTASMVNRTMLNHLS